MHLPKPYLKSTYWLNLIGREPTGLGKHLLGSQASLLLVILVTSLTLSGCGPIKLADQAAPALVAPKSLADLPKATASIAPSSATTASSQSARTSTPATTGVKLNEVSTTFTSSHSTYSRGFCGASALVRDLYRETAKTDLVSCYLGTFESHKVLDPNAVAQSSSSSTIYDGHDHYFEMSDFPTANGTNLNGRLKMSLIQDSGGNLTDYKIFACLGGGSSQTEYIAGSFSSSSGASLVMAESNSLGKTRATITGTLSSSSGDWASKTIVGHQAWSQFASLLSINTLVSYQTKVSVKQSRSTLTVNGFVQVTQSPSPLPSTSPSASDLQAVTGVIFIGSGAVIQGMNMNKLSTFALGEGSSNYYDSYLMSSSLSPTTHAAIQSWNGDTKRPLPTASSGSYYPSVLTIFPPTSVSTPTSGFQTGETWDCSVPSSDTATAINYTVLSASDATLSTDLSTCNSTYLLTDTGYVDCSTTQ